MKTMVVIVVGCMIVMLGMMVIGSDTLNVWRGNYAGLDSLQIMEAMEMMQMLTLAGIVAAISLPAIGIYMLFTGGRGQE